jgi:hypothetical protein
MRGRILSGALALAGSLLLSACSLTPSAVVAVPRQPNVTPQPPEKPLYQIQRLEARRGKTVLWGFVNDVMQSTVLQFDFGDKSNPFEDRFPFQCFVPEASTLRRIKTSTVGTSTRAGAPRDGQAPVQQGTPLNGPIFNLPAATAAGPSVCMARLKVLGSAALAEHPYTIYQDNKPKQDPVIIIRK